MLKKWELNLYAMSFCLSYILLFLQILQMMQYTRFELLQVMLCMTVVAHLKVYLSRGQNWYLDYVYFLLHGSEEKVMDLDL